MSAVPSQASKRACGRTITRSLNIDGVFDVDPRVHLSRDSLMQMCHNEILIDGVLASHSLREQIASWGLEGT